MRASRAAWSGIAGAGWAEAPLAALGPLFAELLVGLFIGLSVRLTMSALDFAGSAIAVQTGLGFGVKKFQLVWVFATKSALDGFVDSGWEFGGQATAAAQYEGEGAATQGALSVSPGVWLYQLTDDGLALELTVKGTKYYKDDDLN